MGSWFGKTRCWPPPLILEAMSLVSSDRVMLQIVEMSLMAPRFGLTDLFLDHLQLVGKPSKVAQ